MKEIRRRTKLWWRIRPISQEWKAYVESHLAPRCVDLKRRFPAITANHITLFRMLPAALGFWLFITRGASSDAPLYLYLTAALMDFADGAWARANNETSTTGKIIDPAVDKCTVVPYLFAGAHFGLLSLPMVLLILCAEIASTAAYVAHITRIQRVDGANWWGGSKKVLQDTLIVFMLGFPTHTLWVVFNTILGISGILSVMSCHTKLRHLVKQSGRAQSSA